MAAGAAAVAASTGRETGNVTSVVPTTSLVARSASSAVILEAVAVEAAVAVDVVVVVGAPVETAAVERTTGERATGVVIAASNITLRDGISATSAGSLSKLQPAE